MSSSQSQNSLFRQQQHLYRSAHYLAKSKIPTSYIPPSQDGSVKGMIIIYPPVAMATITTITNFVVTILDLLGRKRRASYDDEEMTNGDTIDFKPPVQFQQPQHLHPQLQSVREDEILHTTKRNRISLKKEFPISKLLGKRLS